MTVNHTKQKKPDPCSFVIFGVTGDLAHRLVVPALYNLAANDLLPDSFCIVGIARKAMSSEQLSDSLMKGLRQFATRKVDDAIATAAAGLRHLHRSRSEGSGLIRRHARTARQARGHQENRRQSPVLPRNASQRLPADQPRSSAAPAC